MKYDPKPQDHIQLSDADHDGPALPNVPEVERCEQQEGVQGEEDDER